jgi:hypothetical protein
MDDHKDHRLTCQDFHFADSEEAWGRVSPQTMPQPQLVFDSSSSVVAASLQLLSKIAARALRLIEGLGKAPMAQSIIRKGSIGIIEGSSLGQTAEK